MSLVLNMYLVLYKAFLFTEFFNCHVPLLLSAAALLKKNEDPAGTTNMNAKYDLLRDEKSDACLGHEAICDSMDIKVVGHPYLFYVSRVCIFMRLWLVMFV